MSKMQNSACEIIILCGLSVKSLKVHRKHVFDPRSREGREGLLFMPDDAFITLEKSRNSFEAVSSLINVREFIAKPSSPIFM